MVKVKRSAQICINCEKAAIDGMTHVKCKRPLGLDAFVSLWRYQGVIRQALLKLKYKFALEIANELVIHIDNFIQRNGLVFPNKPVLVPIPLHRLRSNWRGFNQAEKIGKLLSLRLNWEFMPDLLKRKRLTRPQTELKGRERRENVRGVFSLNPTHRSLITENRSLILFDDVFTTGATIKEATKVLKRNGVKKVWGLTIAR